MSERAAELLTKANKHEPLSLDELAELANLAGHKITRSMIWKIENQAFEKLRRWFPSPERK
jgi:predicted transcriptional regulator